MNLRGNFSATMTTSKRRLNAMIVEFQPESKTVTIILDQEETLVLAAELSTGERISNMQKVLEHALADISSRFDWSAVSLPRPTLIKG